MEHRQSKQESRYFSTAARMDEAFLELLGEKDPPFITVKEICRRAGVNRSTFYLHYETIDDLLVESIERMNREFFSYFQADVEDFETRLISCPVEELNFLTLEYLRPYLAYVKDHERLFRTALDQHVVLRAQGTYEWLFTHIFSPVLVRAGVPAADREYLVMFYLRGTMAIVEHWLEGGCADDIDHVAGLIQRCVSSSKAVEVGEHAK